MAPSERVRHHIRHNAIAYVALFIALGGTAIALPGKSKVKKNDIARGAVVGKAIAADAVKKAKIRDGAVGTAKLDAGAVIESTLADFAVTGPKLAEDSVSRNKIVQGSINGGKLANGAIDSAKVAQGSLLAEDFAPGQISDAFLHVDAAGAEAFAIQRPGRVYVTATVVAECATLPCNDDYAVEIDGAAVPGTELAFPQALEFEQLTLVGLSAPLAAGSHQIEFVSSAADPDEVVNLAGVLIQ
jgi:hypothetical protein